MNIRINGVNLIISLKVRKMIHDKFVVKLDQLLPQFNNELKTASLNIQKDKTYMVNFETSNMSAETLQALVTSIMKTLRTRLDIDRCIFVPVIDGKPLITISELTEQDVLHVKALYNKINEAETKSSN